MLLESEPGFEVVAEAGELDEISQVVEEAHPDVLLLDVHMRGGASLDLIPGLAGTTQVLVLTMQDDPGYARTALRAGARGYVLKEAEDSELVQAVRIVATGGTYLDPAVGGKVLAAADDSQARLTDREREVLGLIATGLSNDELAETLVISPATVRTHINRVMAKLAARDRAQLVVIAYEAGLVVPGRRG